MRILAVVLTPVLVGLLTELVFRGFVSVTDYPRYFWDPVVGPRRAPQQEGRFIHGRHINAHYHLNAQGWNYPRDFLSEKPAGSRRICLIGDSYIEALNVDTEDGMFRVIERTMSQGGRPVECYPFGCSGWGTTQELEVLRHYALNYHPDAIVILFTQNDPMDSSPYVMPIERQVATYYLDATDQLQLLPAMFWEPQWWRRAQTHSAFLRYLVVQKGLGAAFRRQQTQKIPTIQAPLRQTAFTDRAHDVAGIDELSMEQRQERTWRLIAATLKRCRDIAAVSSSRFGLVYRGSYAEIDSPITPRSLPPRSVDPFCLGDRTDAMGQEWLEPIAKRLDIPYLDLTQDLKSAVARTREPHSIPDDGHYTTASHKVAGEALARWVGTWW